MAQGANPEKPELRCAPVGACFCVRPAFVGEISKRLADVRQKIATARSSHRFAIYLSVPISSGNGSDFDVNVEAAEKIAKNVATTFGEDHVVVVDPASISMEVDNQRASQGEYMYLWAQLIGGEDGFGRDLDAIYFVGPGDYHRQFGIHSKSRLGEIGEFFDKRYASKASFKKSVDEGKLTRDSFIAFYGLRASSAFSRGAHDEWNLVSSINDRRARSAAEFGIPASLPVWFDGNAIEPGDFSDAATNGNVVSSCK